MNPAECDTAHGKSAGCGAQAPLPRLPRLKKDNCIINGRHRSVFIAQENIRLYSWKFGERNVGVLTVTAADTLKSSDFQKKWHSFINSLRKLFPTGMWVRERQPRSGNWHAHAVVNKKIAAAELDELLGLLVKAELIYLRSEPNPRKAPRSIQKFYAR